MPNADCRYWFRQIIASVKDLSLPAALWPARDAANSRKILGNEGAGSRLVAASKDIVGDMSAPRETVACYRLYAAHCLEIAENIPDRDRRIFLLRTAQAWTRLADHVEKYGNDAAAGDGAGGSSD
jgi:hypothetical protein